MTNSRRKGKNGEEWRPVKGFEGIYEVSDLGRIRRIGRCKNIMAINSKRKGKVGEEECVRLCKAEGYDAHRSAQFCGNNESGAADVVGLPGIHIEVKRVEHLNLDDALAQSTRDAAKTDKAIPIVLHRRNNTRWKVTMDAHDWFKLYREWEAGLVDE